MRIAALPPTTTLVAFFAIFAFGCSSSTEPLDPEVDPGGEHQGGGIEPGVFDSVTGSEIDYPAGPYGHDVGTVVENFRFTGMATPMVANYVANKDSLGTISLADYYNPNGDPNKPVVLLVNASALWCSVCKAEASTSMAGYAHWKPKGVEFVTAIFEDDDSEPAEFIDIEFWSKRYKLEYPVVLDPALTLGAFFDKSASPFNMIIDTRTMKIMHAESGLIDLGPENAMLKYLTSK